MDIKLFEEFDEEYNENNRYMFFSNLKQIIRQCEELLELDEQEIEEMLNDGHDWAEDHIATSNYTKLINRNLL